MKRTSQRHSLMRRGLQPQPTSLGLGNITPVEPPSNPRGRIGLPKARSEIKDSLSDRKKRTSGLHL